MMGSVVKVYETPRKMLPIGKSRDMDYWLCTGLMLGTRHEEGSVTLT